MSKKAFFQNTADKKTPALERANFVGHSFEMMEEILNPGDVMEATEEEAVEIRKTHAHLIRVGAITEVEEVKSEQPKPEPEAAEAPAGLTLDPEQGDVPIHDKEE